MADLPPFVTEMNRDEMSLRRMLSVGFKGLGPFNFAGGSNHGRWESVNNWGGFSWMATSIDFSGMIGFDGRRGAVFANARRLAGCIKACEEFFALAEPTTSWDGGPTCANAMIGAREAEVKPGRVYSLMRGESACVFALNDSDHPLSTTVTVGALTVPRHSDLTVSPHYDHMVLFGMPLPTLDAVITYSTAEVTSLAVDGERAILTIAGIADSTGEIALRAPAGISVVASDGITSQWTEGATTTLVLAFAPEPREARLLIGQRTLVLRTLAREAAGWDGLVAPPMAIAPEAIPAASWTSSDVAVPALSQSWRGPGRSLESLGLLHGAGWYELIFSATGGSEMSIAHAGDLVAITLDGVPLGSRRCDGNALTIILPQSLAPGEHRLLVRVEIWGHPNFDDTRWPSCRFGSQRGAFGEVTLDGQVIDPTWRFGTEPTPTAGPTIPGAGLGAPFGCQRLAESTLTRTLAHGAVLCVAGVDCHGHLRVDGELVGRYLLGPTLTPLMVGGPSHRFYLPASRTRQGARLGLTLHGTSVDGRLDSVTLEELVAH